MKYGVFEMKYRGVFFNGVKLDVYRILDLFKVTDPTMQHIIKKAIRFGDGHKSVMEELKDIKDTIDRRIEMEEENKRNKMEPKF